jgi:TRAP-type C4-dicarboxylate transport system substrate-binding protein
MKNIEIATNGRVVFDPINWKGLFGAKELQGAAADGAIDVAWSSPMYTPSENPLRTLLIGGPFLVGTVAAQAHCLTYLYETYEPVTNDFHKNGVVLLYSRPGPSMLMITGDMISGPADLIGMKIRAHGKVFSAGMANLGAIPVLVEAFDIEQQMRAGNLDASSETGGTTGATLARNIGGTTTLIEPMIGPYGSGHQIMGKDKWDSLPADIQQVFIDNRYRHTNIAIQNVAADYQVMMKAIEESGQPYMAFTRAQLQELKDLMNIEAEIDKLLAEVDAAGFPGTEALAKMRQCAAIVDKINPTPANGASDIDMAKVIGLSAGEPYEN